LYSSGTNEVSLALNGAQEVRFTTGTTYFNSIVRSNTEFHGPNGSNTDPTFTFYDDQDVGLYLVSTGTLGFTTAGTQRATLNSNGLYVASDIYRTQWTDYFSSSTKTGWSASSGQIYYKRIGKTMIVSFYISGTSNAASAKFTLPVAATTSCPTAYYFSIRTVNNGSSDSSSGAARLFPSSSSTTVECVRSWNSNPAVGDFTASGTKQIMGTIVYETA
jgi:hypothetical protein